MYEEAPPDTEEEVRISTDRPVQLLPSFLGNRKHAQGLGCAQYPHPAVGNGRLRLAANRIGALLLRRRQASYRQVRQHPTVLGRNRQHRARGRQPSSAPPLDGSVVADAAQAWSSGRSVADQPTIHAGRLLRPDGVRYLPPDLLADLYPGLISGSGAVHRPPALRGSQDYAAHRPAGLILVAFTVACAVAHVCAQGRGRDTGTALRLATNSAAYPTRASGARLRGAHDPLLDHRGHRLVTILVGGGTDAVCRFLLKEVAHEWEDFDLPETEARLARNITR